MHNFKNIRKFALCIVSLICLVGCGKKDATLPLPTTYTIGEDSAPVLDVQAEDSGAFLQSTDTPETSQADGGLEYTYAGLTSGGETVKSYITTLEKEQSGFILIDENGAECQAPDYTTPTGTVTLAKPSAQAGNLFKINLSWTEKSCNVLVNRTEGALSSEEDGMTLVEAMAFFKGLSPNILGLVGTHMNDYSVYPIEGAVLVDGQPCLRLSVYRKDVSKRTTNTHGIYFLSNDQKHLYRLNELEDTVTSLSLSKSSTQQNTAPQMS